MVRPIYPELARQAHVEGTVSLNCFIGLDGSVEKIDVKTGPALLVQAAITAVSQWRYKPLLLNGKAVEMQTIVNIRFQLPKEEKKIDALDHKLVPSCYSTRRATMGSTRAARRAGT